MKILRKIVVGLCAAVILLAAVFCAGRYGWKALGFRACQGAGIESVSVRDHAVEIKGFYPGSFPEGFCGYYAEEQDGTLYVGFRFSAVFGSFETGDFDVTIPVKSEIREVILKTKAMETSLWIREDGAVPDSSAAATPVLTLPILDEINGTVTVGTSGSSLLAVQAAVKLLDLGINTGLGTDEIEEAASAWLTRQGGNPGDCLHKLSLVDDAYRKLLTGGARGLLDNAGLEAVEITWGSEPVEPVEAIMQAAGLR